MEDVTVCQSYTLPALSANNTYHAGSDCSGTLLNAGDVVTTSETITICAQNGDCSDSSNFVVTIVPLPVLAPVSNILACDSYSLPALAVGGYYATDGGVDPITGPITAVGATHVYVYASAGIDGCSAQVDFTVTITPSPGVPEIADVTSCGPYALPVTEGIHYYNGTGATGGEITTVAASQPVYAYATNGNCSSEASFSVVVTDVPEVQIAGGCRDEVYVLDATVLNNQGANLSYSWSSEGGGDIVSGGDSASATVSGTGTYTVTVTVAGCDGQAQSFVSSTSCMIQKGISVNGDGKNDTFDLTGFNVSKLEIYNRYGMKVYERTHYTNEWGGQSDNGDELPDGTYYFMMERNDNQPTKTGWIYINREN
jgi:gliding motility-associated-like protein